MRTIIPPAPARYLKTAAVAARGFAISAYQAVCPIHGSELAPVAVRETAVRQTAVRRNGERVCGW
jgi:hypothetical protein